MGSHEDEAADHIINQYGSRKKTANAALLTISEVGAAQLACNNDYLQEMSEKIKHAPNPNKKSQPF